MSNPDRVASPAPSRRTAAGCATLRAVAADEPNQAARVYEVAITRTAFVAGPRDRVFASITAEDVLPLVLTGYGPLPAVVATSEETGPWDQPGSSRLVHLADATTAREQLTHHHAPESFAYRVWDFGNPVMRTLALNARGCWRFDATAGGTRVSWTYTFTARNALAVLPLFGVISILWRGYMDVCLQHLRMLAAADGRATGA